MKTSDYLRAQKPDTAEMILLEWIRTEFNLPPSIAQVCDQYFLRIWDGNFVVSHCRDHLGSFKDANGRKWIPHWQSSPVVCQSASKLACSFREYRGRFYVVIKVWGEQ